MPELPDVETIQAPCRAALQRPRRCAHGCARSWQRGRGDRRRIAAPFAGQTPRVVRPSRQGAVCRIRRCNDARNAFRNQRLAAGRTFRCRAAAVARLLFEFADGDQLAYINPRRIGHVCVIDDVDAFIASQHLGPDALDPAFDAKAFAAELANRRQAIKAAIMDQTRMAGIGNTYADEILFQARAASRRDRRQNGRCCNTSLFGAVKSVLRPRSTVARAQRTSPTGCRTDFCCLSAMRAAIVRVAARC